MNSLVGKSTGIALLLAAGLLAALFAMGVFSATGVGAQETEDEGSGVTATAVLADLNDPVTADTQADDTLTITFTGLPRIAGHAANAVLIEMPERLATTDSELVARWLRVGDQVADTFIETYDDVTDDDVSGDDGYMLAFEGTNILEDGEAQITIALAAGANVRDNIKIASITIGQGAAEDGNLISVDIPADGLEIEGAPEGPAITLDPDTGDTSEADDAFYEVEVSGVRFNDEVGAENVVIAAVASDGDEVDINGLDPDNLPNLLSGTTVQVLGTAIIADDGEFTATVYIPVESGAETITMTATQGTSVSASECQPMQCSLWKLSPPSKRITIFLPTSPPLL